MCCPKCQAYPVGGPECPGSHRPYIIVGVIQTVLKFQKDNLGGKTSMKKIKQDDVLESGRVGAPGVKGAYTLQKAVVEGEDFFQEEQMKGEQE